MKDVKQPDLIVNPVFVGLTRPATVLGVTYITFVIEFVGVAFVFLATANPLWLALLVPVHGLMYMVSAQDQARASNWMLSVITKGRCLNRLYWRSSTFSPTTPKRVQKSNF